MWCSLRSFFFILCMCACMCKFVLVHIPPAVVDDVIVIVVVTLLSWDGASIRLIAPFDEQRDIFGGTQVERHYYHQIKASTLCLYLWNEVYIIQKSMGMSERGETDGAKMYRNTVKMNVEIWNESLNEYTHNQAETKWYATAYTPTHCQRHLDHSRCGSSRSCYICPCFCLPFYYRQI